MDAKGPVNRPAGITGELEPVDRVEGPGSLKQHQDGFGNEIIVLETSVAPRILRGHKMGQPEVVLDQLVTFGVRHAAALPIVWL
jgi:hypothetical protein